MTRIVVLDNQADGYRAGLAHLDPTVHFATNPADCGVAADVLLAQPDLAAQYLAGGGKAKWIQSTWAGVSPLIDVVRRQKILLTGLKGVFGPLVAEYVFTYLLQDVRRPGLYAAQQSRNEWNRVAPGKLAGKRLSIVGTGSIGTHIALVAKSFGMYTTGISRSGAANKAFDEVSPIHAVFEGIGRADYVVVALPETTETRGLLAGNFFASLSRNVMLVNVGRGSTIAESSLRHALHAHRIRKAVLDVFPDEPLPASSPLWALDNVVITPHVAALTDPADILPIFLRNLAHFEAGAPLENVIDLEAGY